MDISTSIASQPRSPLLEREDDLDRLSGLARAAAGGQGAIASIRGRPGEGKTTLLTAACGLAGEHGLRVFHARGSELEGDFAFGVVRQLLEGEIVGLAPAERGGAPRRRRRARRWRLRPRAGAPPEGPLAVLHGLYWVLAGLAARGPVLLAVDDLHWADATTLEWLAYLSGRIEGMPILIVLATRPPEPGAELLARLTALSPRRSRSSWGRWQRSRSRC